MQIKIKLHNYNNGNPGKLSNNSSIKNKCSNNSLIIDDNK